MPKKKENLSLEEKLQKAIIPKEEEPYKIPDNWIWIYMNKLVDVRDGTHDSPNFYSEGYPLITSKNLKKNKINFEDVKFISKEDMEKINQRSRVEKGDILYAMIGTIGNPVYCEVDSLGKFAVKNVAIFKPFDRKISKFLKYYLESENYKKLIEAKIKGTTQKFIPLNILRNILLPLPSFEEQKRIVEKLDSLFEKTQKIKDIIEEVKEKTVLRREAILSKAFTGELTEKWRSENKTSSAEELLYKINNEKIRVWEEECKKAEEEGRKKPKKPQIKDISEMLVKEDEIPYKVPDNWVWTRLGNIIDINMGQSPKGENVTQKFSENSFGLIGGPSDMGNNFPIISRYTTTPTKLSEEGEVILSIRATLGKTIFSDGKYCLGRGVCSLKSKIIDRNILRFYLTNITEYLYSIGTGSTFLQISKSDIENILFPLPSLEEQKEIVRILDKVFEEENKISELLLLEGKVEALEKTILDKAFRGELGTGNIEDEPAAELLKKILETK